MKKIIIISLILSAAFGTAYFGFQESVDSRLDIEEFLAMDASALQDLAKYDRPDLATLHEFRMTRDPKLGYPPVQRMFEADRYAKTLVSSRRVVDEASWVERGPNNFGGRTRALMFDPNDILSKKVWSAGVGGGLWVNTDITDEYSRWTSVNDFFGNIAITAIAYDPINTNIFYFGTGEGWNNFDAIRGNGIWKSEDAGVTWTHLMSTMDNSEFSYVQKLAVTNKSTLLAATRESGGIMRSIDGGTSWTRVVKEGRGAEIEIVGNTIYASTGIGGNGKLWKSQDDGVTWKEITPDSGLGRMEIGVNENFPNTMYVVADKAGAVGGFYRSSNGGDSWTPITIPRYIEQSCNPGDTDFTRSAQAWYDLILAVDPTDKNAIIVGGIDLYKSLDGGKNWELISYWTGACDVYVHADHHNFIFRPGHPKEAIAATDGGLYYTTNFDEPLDEGGPYFTPRNTDYNVAQFYSCAMINEAGRDYFLAGAQDNGSHQFFNPGVNSTNEITGGDGSFCFIDQDDPNIQITSFTNNNYNITRDFWDSNVRVSTSGNKGRFINPAEYNSNTNTLFAAGGDDLIIRYAIPDEGDIEVEELALQLNEEAISALCNSKFDDNIMFVGTGEGGIFKLSNINAGVVATRISNSQIEEGIYISSITVGSNIDHLIITASNYGVTSVYETKDGGANWKSKEGNLPDMPIRWSLINPNNFEEVLLATELGVWSSSNFSSDSPTWGPINTGLANTRCDMLKYRESDGLVAVATHGRGLFTSDLLATKSSSKFYSVDIGYSNQEISFTNSSILASTHSWDFGDGSTSTEVNPKHIFTNSGTYDVSLTINGESTLKFTRQLKVLPKLSVDYSIADGGNFDVNQDHFYPVTVRGTGFELGNSSVNGKSGTNSGSNAWVTGLESDKYAPNSIAYLYSPQFDFSASGVYTIQFYTQYALESEWEGFTLEYSIDNGNSWKKLGNYLSVENWYNETALSEAVAWTPGEFFFSGSTSGYVLKSAELPELSNQAAVSFRFVFKSDPGTEFAGIAIDDFSIKGPDVSNSTLSFYSLQTDVCLGEVVTFVNTSTGNLSDYTWDFGAAAVPSSATGFGPHQVLFRQPGVKSVTLNAVFDNGDLTSQENLNVFPNPVTNLTVPNSAFELCAQETAVIEITNSEKDITYSLIDVNTGEVSGSPQIGNDGSITLTSLNLNFGLQEFRVLAQNANECTTYLEAYITVNVKRNPAVVIIDLGAGKLKASPGDSYQWLRDGVPIEGATQIEYSYREAGAYTVEVAYGSCISTSDVFLISVLDVNKLSDGFEIYPNPVKDLLSIKLNKHIAREVSIYDLNGRVVKRITDGLESAIININVTELKAGIYQVEILTDKGLETRKLLKL